MLQQCASRCAGSSLQALTPCVQQLNRIWLGSTATGALHEGVGEVLPAVNGDNGSCSSQPQQLLAGIQQRQLRQTLHNHRQPLQEQYLQTHLPLLGFRSHLLQQQQLSPLHAWAGSSRAFSSSSSRLPGQQPQQPSLAVAAAAAAAGLSHLLPATTWHLGQQLQQQRGVRQMLPFDMAPKPLPRFRKPSKDGRMNRMVIRIPPQVQVELQDSAITLTGKAGSTSLKLPFLDPTGLVAWQAHTQGSAEAAAGPGTGSLLLLASPSKRCWRGIQTHINNAVHGVMQGYLVGVTVQGVGYRMEPVPAATIAAALAARRGTAPDGSSSSSSSKASRRIIWEQEAEKTNIAYPHKEPSKAVRLKVGYTRACIFQLPEGVLAFFVKPNLMYLYSIDKALVTNTAAAIRAVRKPNAYTGNGIQLVGEVLKLRQRAGSK